MNSLQSDQEWITNIKIQAAKLHQRQSKIYFNICLKLVMQQAE